MRRMLWKCIFGRNLLLRFRKIVTFCRETLFGITFRKPQLLLMFIFVTGEATEVLGNYGSI